jgi:hypothetical protein
MKKKFYSLLVGCGLISALMVGCKKDDDLVDIPQPIINEPENITTVKVVLTPTAGGSALTFQYKDPDGNGGNAPIQDTIKLVANTVYNVGIEFWDDSKSPAVNLTNEIQEEKDDHLIVISHSNVNISTEILDKDSKNLNLGLSSKWTTTGISAGTSKIVLKHQPGIKDGSIDKGETDVEVTFISKIQ